MRIVKDITHPRFKITVFSWNNKYIIKIEDAHLEQVYKIDEHQVTGLAEIDAIVSNEFLIKALKRFAEMSEDFNHAWNYRHSNANTK